MKISKLVLAAVLGMLSFSITAAEIKIGSLVSSQVTKINVKPGQTVPAGYVLLTLDMNIYNSKLKALQAEVKKRELALADATIEFEQVEDLFERAVIAKRPYDLGKLAFEQAEQALIKAKADLEHHQAWKNYYEIKAPVKSKVKSLEVTQGSTVYYENQLMIVLETE